MNKIRKGDTVKILSGNDRGKTGVVHAVMPKDGRLIVEGVNLIKKHQKRQQNLRTQAGIIEREGSIAISNVMVVCKTCGKSTRVAFQVAANGSKTRVCKHCGNALS